MRFDALLRYTLLVCIALSVFCSPLRAQIPIGKEFIVPLPPVTTIAERNDTTIVFSLEIYCSRQTSLSFKWGDGTTLLNNVTINAGNKYYLSRPLFQLFQIMQPYENYSVNDTANARAIIVTADQPVSVHATYSKPHRTETYTVPPTNAYGLSYILGTYQGYSMAGNRTGFTIMARENGTTVTIVPRQSTRFSRQFGQPYTMTLNKNQVYTTLAVEANTPQADLSGTTIASNKPIGMISFSYASDVPRGKVDSVPGGGGPGGPTLHFPDGGFTCKDLIDAQYPDSAAGMRYYTAPLKRQKQNLVRLIILSDTTRIDTNGVSIKRSDFKTDTIFKRGSVFDITISGPVRIDGDHPFIATQFTFSSDSAGIDTTLQVNNRDTTMKLRYGDPAQVFLHPVTGYKAALQWVTPNLEPRQSLSIAPQIPFYWEHYVLITAPVSAADGGVKLDGRPLTLTERHFDGEYATGVVPIGISSHILEADVPISAIPYGFTINDSYASEASEALRSVARLGTDTLRFITCDASFDTTITVENLGTNTFKIDSVVASGLDVKVLTPPSFPQAYLPQVKTVIELVIKTPQPGTYSGTLKIYTDANNKAVFEIPIIAVRDSAQLGLPSTIDFGVLGSTQSQHDTTIVIHNTGARPLIIQPATLTGGGFQVIRPKTAAITIPPGGTDSLVVRFIPPSDGLKEATIRLTGVPCLVPVTIKLSGFKGSGASVQVQRTINYQSYLCSAPASVDSTIVLKSVGDETVTIQSTSMTGANASEFSLLENLTGVQIKAKDSVIFHVRYTPGGYGARTATLVLTTTAANAPTINIDLFARRDSAGLMPSIDAMEFGARTPCDPDTTQVLMLTNTGTVPDTITTLDLGSAVGYTLSPEPTPGNPLIIFPNGTQAISVTFSPLGVGTYPGTILIGGSPCALSGSVTLSGSRVKPSLALDQTSMEFDTLYQCQSAKTKRLTVRNDGTVPDTITAASIAGSAGFAESAALPIILQPGESATIDVTLDPSAEGVLSAELSLEWQPCQSMSRLALHGVALHAATDLSAASIDFGTVKVGNTGSGHVMLHNTGSAPRVISTITVPGGVTITKPTLPVVVAGGDSVEIDFVWTPTAPGDLIGTSTLTIAEPCGSSSSITFTGTAKGDELLPVSLTVTLPNVQGTVDQSVGIPIMVTGGQNLAASGATSMHVSLRYRYTMLLPVRVSTSLPGMSATMSSSRIEGNDRIVEIDLTGGTFADQGELARLECQVLLGDSTSTMLRLDSVGVTFPAGPPFAVLTVAKQNGRFDAEGICTTGGDRLFVVSAASKVTSVKPNPFRGGTTIQYETSGAGKVELTVVDAHGADVATLFSGDQPEGLHEVYFDASAFASGVYFCELRHGASVDRVPIVLVQ